MRCFSPSRSHSEKSGRFSRALLALVFVLSSPFETPAESAPSGGEAARRYYVPPHKIMLEEPVEFHGYRGGDVDWADVDEIRIGFFGPPGGAMWRGATLALDQANKEGGFHGKHFRLITRWAADPWSAGSNMVIRLVYEDKVWAVIGGVDGTSTHIAQQIVTKARVPLLSPTATDPTLTYVRVPWIFRLPPDDRHQADLIAHQVLTDLRNPRIVLVNSTGHDHRIGAEEVLQALLRRQHPPVAHLSFDSPLLERDHLAGRILSASPDAMIMLCDAPDAVALMETLAAAGAKWTVYCPLSLNVPAFRSAAQSWEGGVILTACQDGGRTIKEVALFSRAYRARFSKEPEFPAQYAYDSARLIVRAVRVAGLNRAGIRDAIAADRDFIGVIGPVRWDNGGGNVAPLRLLRLP